MSNFSDKYGEELAKRVRSETERAEDGLRRRRVVEAKVRELASALKGEEAHLRRIGAEVTIGYCGTAEVWNGRDGSLDDKLDRRSVDRWVCAIRADVRGVPGALDVSHDEARYCHLWFGTDNFLKLSPIGTNVQGTMAWIAGALANGLRDRHCASLGMSRPEPVVILGWWSPRCRVW
jgi:hypothetical protein